MSLRGNRQNSTRSIATRFSKQPALERRRARRRLERAVERERALPELGQPLLNAARQIAGPLGRRQRHAPQNGLGHGAAPDGSGAGPHP
jgi:hypothetical protein